MTLFKEYSGLYFIKYMSDVYKDFVFQINRALAKDVGTLFICEEGAGDGAHPLFGLLASELTQIKPNYEAMIRGGHLKVTDMGIQHGMYVSVVGSECNLN